MPVLRPSNLRSFGAQSPLLHVALGVAVVTAAMAVSARGWLIPDPVEGDPSLRAVRAPILAGMNTSNIRELPFVANTPTVELVVATDQDTLDRFRASLVPQDPGVRRFYRLISSDLNAEALLMEIGMLANLSVPMRVFDFRE